MDLLICTGTPLTFAVQILQCCRQAVTHPVAVRKTVLLKPTFPFPDTRFIDSDVSGAIHSFALTQIAHVTQLKGSCMMFFLLIIKAAYMY